MHGLADSSLLAPWHSPVRASGEFHQPLPARNYEQSRAGVSKWHGRMERAPWPGSFQRVAFHPNEYTQRYCLLD
eukprot:CAMPEP_0178586446 /NCGR_PEP_ID=MMETSP0697-20121206/25922_1 /TAXON_ID=265572 /ORGANISM="Extubocellulus spinifer, Strain CCMP396" /LENGTH=73 /DNA_ID=CAMNT_0020222565 /DNA_START=120 /DNA_END=341 /DNA_ORIENTATION=+